MKEPQVYSIIDEGFRNDETCVMAIGVFDSVHRGHAKLLRAGKKLAADLGGKFFVLTFDPHPDKVLRPDSDPTKLIYPLEIRVEILADREGFMLPQDCAADKVFVKKFTRDFASGSPESFLAELKEKFPGLKALVTGENFKFGKGAVADVAWLKAHAPKYGIEAHPVGGLKDGGEFVSSTRLRKALSEADMYEFSCLAGRPYFAEGKVSEGRHLGRKLGFPTLNLKWNQECVPPYGVYAVGLTNLDTEEAYAGVANYGVNPTVGLCDPVVETNLFSDVDFGAGTKIRVEFFEFIRPEINFKSLEDLKKQMQKDKTAAQELWANEFGG